MAIASGNVLHRRCASYPDTRASRYRDLSPWLPETLHGFLRAVLTALFVGYSETGCVSR
jgi:hypothetical protein